MTANLSVQLISVRDALKADRDGTLGRLAAIGFRHVEPYGVGNDTISWDDRLARVRELRDALDRAELRVSGVHASFMDDEQRSASEVATECRVLGTSTAIIPMPGAVRGFGKQTFASRDELGRFADRVNSLAAALREEGIDLGYHNHWYEWAAIEVDLTGYTHFWANVDEHVVAELDVYWAAAAGVDPARVAREIRPRLHGMHVKDGPGVRDEPQTPLGTGLVDPLPVVCADDSSRWHVLEIDSTDMDEFDLLARNAEILTGARSSSF